MSFCSKYFLESKSMEHQLSNALSTMFLRHLVMFLHFETYALANPQKYPLPPISGPQLDFLPHITRSTNQGGVRQGLKILVTFCSI